MDEAATLNGRLVVLETSDARHYEFSLYNLANGARVAKLPFTLTDKRAHDESELCAIDATYIAIDSMDREGRLAGS